MRAYVVDDEPVARRRLRRMLGRHPGVDVVGEAADGESALDGIGSLEPDVAFLDIRMPGMDGLELAGRLPDSTSVIFTTAYDEYAVQAFAAAAVDYLVKPVEAERLAAAIGRVRRRRPALAGEDLERLLAEVARRREVPRVSAQCGGTVRVFDAREISRLSARDRYAAFRQGEREYLLEESLAALEERLRPWGFVRVHRGELVNLDAVRALRREDDATLVDLADGQSAPVSRRFLKGLKERLGMR